ncbi:hypothetical protein [Campylobacter sp. CCUG 57310]|uniref:hypothetical protein n=1 Tax=Campylobacter sp. CCUG 57310 TaxID=2517362 RepID=UPI001564B873|nr:hypothetical protein [Campylobacter sp. CCUG 57310]QKF92740.1 putative membrane protein [Campylobacter sp. CCUG 57310]
MRDYDKEPIVVRDLSRFYRYFTFTLVMLPLLFYSLANSYNNGVFTKTIILVAISIGLLFYSIYKNIQYYKNGKQIFEINNQNIKYSTFDLKADFVVDNIESVEFVLATNHEYGKDAYKDKSLLSLAFKTDILELFFYVSTKILIAFIYAFFILPFKFISRKSIKTFLIFFKDGGYLNIVPNNKAEFDELLLFFKNKNIAIKNKLNLIYTSHEETKIG